MANFDYICFKITTMNIAYLIVYKRKHKVTNMIENFAFIFKANHGLTREVMNVQYKNECKKMGLSENPNYTTPEYSYFRVGFSGMPIPEGLNKWTPIISLRKGVKYYIATWSRMLFTATGSTSDGSAKVILNEYFHLILPESKANPNDGTREYNRLSNIDIGYTQPNPSSEVDEDRGVMKYWINREHKNAQGKPLGYSSSFYESAVELKEDLSNLPHIMNHWYDVNDLLHRHDDKIKHLLYGFTAEDVEGLSEAEIDEMISFSKSGQTVREAAAFIREVVKGRKEPKQIPSTSHLSQSVKNIVKDIWDSLEKKDAEVSSDPLEEKVKDVKNSFTVEGVPLIKSNRFTAEEYKAFKTQHHGWHLNPKEHTYSDEEIRDQVYTMMNQNVISKSTLKELYDSLSKDFKYQDLAAEKEIARQKIYQKLGWDKMTPINMEFWKCFGSAPFFISDTNKKLVKYQELYGAKGMNEIFDDRFEKTYHYYSVNNYFQQFDSVWNSGKEIYDLAHTTFTSPYNSVDEMEEELPVKKIKAAAENFYLDKTKDFEERLKAFDKYGDKETYIFRPQDVRLNKIFDIYFEQDYVQRHETVNCLSIIEWWIDSLADERTHISYVNNKYHPDLESSERNYVASENSINRLRKYYIEKLILEKTATFEFDW